MDYCHCCKLVLTSVIDRLLSVLLKLIGACEVIIFASLTIFGLLFIGCKFLTLISPQPKLTPSSSC